MNNPYDRDIVYVDLADKKTKRVRLMDTLIFATVDPSGGASEQEATARTDKCGWCVAAVDVNDNRFILEMDSKHLTDEQFVEHIYAINQQWLPKLIGIEKTPHLLTHFRHIEQRKKLVLPLYELKPNRRKKSDRIRSSGTTFGRTYFIDMDKDRIEQLFRGWYDEMEHGDDALDAFAYLDDIVFPPTPEALQAHIKEVVKIMADVYVELLPKHVQEEWAFVKRFTQSQPSYDEDWAKFQRGE